MSEENKYEIMEARDEEQILATARLAQKREYMKKYREANKEKLKEYNKKWIAAESRWEIPIDG